MVNLHLARLSRQTISQQALKQHFAISLPHDAERITQKKIWLFIQIGPTRRSSGRIALTALQLHSPP
ncbi:hypothetical protein VCRA2130O400_360067 [Vibrio crassostreae]|nr:hypothetical protein VCRA2130O400_360067 [Vibrio crassostreae]